MALPLNGPIVITIPNVAPPSGAFKCVASFRGSASILAESTVTVEDEGDSARGMALDNVISALRSHSLGDLTLLPLLIGTGGALPYKWI